MVNTNYHGIQQVRNTHGLIKLKLFMGGAKFIQYKALIKICWGRSGPSVQYDAAKDEIIIDTSKYMDKGAYTGT
ncbi:hypothetical protein LSPH24S_01084 [Lysinibacillus sphaericus]